jgi:hypothetical protein
MNGTGSFGPHGRFSTKRPLRFVMVVGNPDVIATPSTPGSASSRSANSA